MDITNDFSETSDFIRSKVENYQTKREILAYLTAVKDYVNTSMKMTRAYMKGMK